MRDLSDSMGDTGEARPFTVDDLIAELRSRELNGDELLVLRRCLNPVNDLGSYARCLVAGSGATHVNGVAYSVERTSVEVQVRPQVESVELQVGEGSLEPRVEVCPACSNNRPAAGSQPALKLLEPKVVLEKPSARVHPVTNVSAGAAAQNPVKGPDVIVVEDFPDGKENAKKPEEQRKIQAEMKPPSPPERPSSETKEISSSKHKKQKKHKDKDRDRDKEKKKKKDAEKEKLRAAKAKEKESVAAPSKEKSGKELSSSADGGSGSGKTAKASEAEKVKVAVEPLTDAGPSVPVKPGEPSKSSVKLSDEELFRKYRCRGASVVVKKFSAEKIQRLIRAMKKYGEQRREEERKKEKERKKLKIKELEARRDKLKTVETQVKRRRVESSSSDGSGVDKKKDAKPKIVTKAPFLRREVHSSSDSDDDVMPIVKKKPAHPAVAPAVRTLSVVHSSSDSSDDETKVRTAKAKGAAESKAKIMRAVQDNLKNPAGSSSGVVLPKLPEKRKLESPVPPVVLSTATSVSAAEPAPKRVKVEETTGFSRPSAPNVPVTIPPTDGDDLGAEDASRPPSPAAFSLDGALASKLREEEAKPKFELKSFVSKDEKENEDINNPEWEHLKRITTDYERYNYVRKDWNTDKIPYANVCRTYVSSRTRQRLEYGGANIRFAARPGAVDPRTAHVNLGTVSDCRMNHAFDKGEDGRRILHLPPTYHFDYFWIRLMWKVEIAVAPKQRIVGSKIEKIEEEFRVRYDKAVLPRDRGILRRKKDNEIKLLQADFREYHKKACEHMLEIFVRFYEARKEGLEWEAFYTGLPEASFASLDLKLEQFLNLERFHHVAVEYRNIYGSVHNASEGVVKLHSPTTCPVCAVRGVTRTF